jgi:hypothetical protein
MYSLIKVANEKIKILLKQPIQNYSKPSLTPETEV